LGKTPSCASIVGIDPTILSGGKDGHLGFRVMRERAARIGAKLMIMSAIGTSTDITLVVPRSVAFKNGFACVAGSSARSNVHHTRRAKKNDRHTPVVQRSRLEPTYRLDGRSILSSHNSR